MFIDIVLGIALAYGFYTGYSRGIIKAVFAIVSLLIAIMAAMKLSPLMIGVLDGMLSWDPRLIVILGFVLTFIIVVVAIRFIGKSIEKMMQSLKINFVNKIAGGALMSLVFATAFSCIVWFMDEVRLLSPETKEQSITYELIEPIPRGAAALGKSVKPFFQNFWNKTADAMDRIRQESDENKDSEDQKPRENEPPQ